MEPAATAPPRPPGSTLARQIARAAALIALGNIASRILGLVRASVIAGTFGLSAAVDAFTVASAIPNILYDLLISGAISAALVPVFSEYAEGDEREFRRVAASVINLILCMLAAIIALFIWQAPLLVTLLAGGFSEAIREQTIAMVRLMLPAVLFMGVSGMITALLHARRAFLLPSFTTSVFNIGIIAGVLLLTPLFGAQSLVIGVLIGAVLQVALQLPGLRGAVYSPIIDLRHPGVRRILRLYAPVALGIAFSVAGIVLDRNLASRLAEGSLSTMWFATTLIQFPLGLVAAAVSFAVLPTLSRQAGAGDETAFRTTLGMGIKVVLLLIVPATVGLAVLARPIITIFEGNQFSSEDIHITAWALLLYLPGLPAAAIDQMLLFAFYARKRTLTPNLVQGAAIGVYTLTALGLLTWTQLGVGALVLGNSAQWISHVVILWLLSRRLFNLGGLRLGEATFKCGVASVAMAICLWLVTPALQAIGAPLITVVIAGGFGAAVYFGACALLRVEAFDFFINAVRRRIGSRNEEPRTENEEPRTENREPRTEN
jgi:putative peptidoglycan lipid II flippase